MAAWDSADPLTARERELLREVTTGAGDADIAARLNLAEGTVRNYLSTAMAELGARNRAEAARIARERGWL
jgi:two-component system response regulator DesR